MSLGGSRLGPLIDKELLMNVMGMGLKEVFLTEFENFMCQFPSSRPARQKMAKKNIGKTKGHARIYGFPLLEEYFLS